MMSYRWNGRTVLYTFYLCWDRTSTKGIQYVPTVETQIAADNTCICVPRWVWPRCLPPAPRGSRRPWGGLARQHSRVRWAHPSRDKTKWRYMESILYLVLLALFYKWKYLSHHANILISLKLCVDRMACLHWSGPPCWLLEGKAEPPPRSDHYQRMWSKGWTHPVKDTGNYKYNRSYFKRKTQI
jgi:hypothetical protein